MNALAFLMDIYVSSNRASPEMTRLKSVIRAFQVVKPWTKLEVVEILTSEALSNWFSVEQIADIQNFMAERPFEKTRIIPMAWSFCEALPGNWKFTFEPLKFWALAKCPQMGEEYTWNGWVPITWPSYVVQFRWNLMTATARNATHTIKITPASMGFPLTALTDLGVTAGGHVYRIMMHFMLPTEHTLKISNPNVPNYEASRDLLFSTWRFKEASLPSAWQVVMTKFKAQYDDILPFLRVETNRQAWNAKLARFWRTGRWKVPKSTTSGKKKSFCYKNYYKNGYNLKRLIGRIE